jgi:O-antigen ligase
MTTLYITKASSADLETAKAEAQGQRFSVLLATLLFLLLVFATVTVWVRETWALQLFQIGVYALVIIKVLCGIREGREHIADGFRPLLVYLIPVWGIIQLVANTTTSSFETRGEVLRWGALAGVFYLSQSTIRSQAYRLKFLIAIMCFATGMAVLCLMQLNTSHGQILWFISTPYTDGIYATFQNKNNYCQFAELALPIALWGAVRQGWRSWWYALAAGILYASAIGAASRAGFLLCTCELIAIPIIGMAGSRKTGRGPALGLTAGMMLIVPVVAAAFTFAVGWKPIWERLQDRDPYNIRREFLLAAVDMVKHRPLTGHGLGTFEQVYQRYAVKDFPFYANHAHNDWAEFAADGGIPFLLLVAIPFVSMIPSTFRHPWALGLLATLLNAWVDYPFPRPAVSGWMFAILGMLYMTEEPEKQKQMIRTREEPVRATAPQ